MYTDSHDQHWTSQFTATQSTQTIPAIKTKIAELQKQLAVLEVKKLSYMTHHNTLNLISVQKHAELC